MRLILCIILFFALGWIGVLRSAECRRKPLLMLSLADSLAILQNEICVCRSPLPTALLRCLEVFGETKQFYQMLLVGVRSERSFSEAWAMSVKKVYPYEDEVRYALLSLGEQIGRYDAKTQETAFAVCINTLRDSASQIGSAAKTRARLTIGLGAVTGLLVAVIIY